MSVINTMSNERSETLSENLSAHEWKDELNTCEVHKANAHTQSEEERGTP